ncbi:IS1/IS1595 family N-terminal zinc-binding domain-containing protein [Pragia fontium]|uniref:IS1/IS1595 family N-terminal zinc-binding domain-containing protein n=1 Tax=Pragia fontium TaxID=82985 RepID=UPI0011C041CB|nr:IS1 family transposase [Pragia fontium]
MLKLRRNIICQYCGSGTAVRKHGKSKSGMQRFWCSSCSKTFQNDYIYTSWEHQVKTMMAGFLSQGLSTDEISKKSGWPIRRVNKIILSLELDKG